MGQIPSLRKRTRELEEIISRYIRRTVLEVVEHVERRQMRGSEISVQQRKTESKNQRVPLQPSQVRTTFAIESREGATYVASEVSHRSKVNVAKGTHL